MKKEIKPISQAFNKYEDLNGLILHSDQGGGAISNAPISSST